MTAPLSDRAARHGFTADEYAQILDHMGREPNLTELGIFSAMWSEHCSYKSSRHWLKALAWDAPWVICGPGENAGVVDIGDGLAAVFKMESHNHPSFIEPFQGAATGVGGIMRDVFTMGARPVALLDVLRFGSPTHPRTRHLVSGVVGGIGSYGNCTGVPTVGGQTTFHASCNGNNLVNAMCVGIAPADRIFYAAAGRPGAPVIYVGSRTGRDGIHGASMASTGFDGETEAKRPTVQVGDPFTEKLLLEACLELMASDSIIAIQDMGAAGLTSSAVEMAARGGVGIDLDLDAVPQRETGMTAYELMLSESQERMLMVLHEHALEHARGVFEKWDLDCVAIGRITTSERLVVSMNGRVEADIAIGPLAHAAPVYQRPWTLPEPRAGVGVPASPVSVEAALITLAGCPDLASKRWIWEQYDHLVMGRTVAPPGGDCAVVELPGDRGLAMTVDATPRYCDADPAVGGRQAVAEAWRNLVAVGARPLAVTDCLNFGNPESPAVMGTFVGAVNGIAEASRTLAMPVVSGNVSFYNETRGEAVQPAPTIGAIGLIDDLDCMASIAFGGAEETIHLIGATAGHLGASLWLREITGVEDGPPPPVDLDIERRTGAFVLGLIQDLGITSCHDVSDGGLLVALAEMALACGIGFSVRRPDACVAAHAFWFGEDQGRFVVSSASHGAAVDAAARDAGVTCTLLGRTGGDVLTVDGGQPISIESVRTVNERWLPDTMAGAGETA